MRSTELPLVYVIIVNWNGMRFLPDCLSSVFSGRYSNFKVVLIDNASSDDSIEFVKQHFEQVACVELAENKGFTGANNIGINYALKHGASYSVLLNNDTRVFPDWLDCFVQFAEDNPNVGACGGQQLTWDGKLAMSLNFIPEWADAEMSFSEIDDRLGGYPVVFASGCCLFLRNSFLRETDLFDERYFVGNEDLDLCFRLWIRGHSVMLLPEVKVLHWGGGSSNSKSRMFWGYRNQLFTLLKNYEIETLRLYYRKILRRWVFTRNRIALAATLRNIIEIKHTLIMRQHNQRFRKLSDQEVFEQCQIKL